MGVQNYLKTKVEDYCEWAMKSSTSITMAMGVSLVIFIIILALIIIAAVDWVRLAVSPRDKMVFGGNAVDYVIMAIGTATALLVGITFYSVAFYERTEEEQYKIDQYKEGQ